MGGHRRASHCAHRDSDDRTHETDKDPYVNIRSLTRGDGVVIGAAVLLFIASFLPSTGGQDCSGPLAKYCEAQSYSSINAWDSVAT